MLTLIRPLVVLAALLLGSTYCGFGASVAWADLALPEDPQAKGYALFAEADRRESGYGDLQVTLRMELHSARSRSTERALRIRQLEIPEDADQVLLVFDAPANIRGTALLSHAHVAEDDEQWLFLPALKRTKKIASRNKTGPFVGSEFSFEDLSPREVSEYSYAYVGTEMLAGEPHFVVDRFPKDRFSGYSRQRVWLHQTHFTITRIDYANRSEEVSKRLTVSGYHLYEDRFWKPSHMLMENLRSGKSTVLHWDEYQFGLGFSAERDFSVNSLRRAR